MIGGPRARLVLLVGLTVLLGASCRGSTSPATPNAAPLVDLLGRNQFRVRAETRRIVFGAGDRRHLRDGWSIDENDPQLGLSFVWATAPEASVSFDLLQLEDLQFLVRLRAFQGEVPQEIAVLVNGREVSRFVAPPVFLEYRFVVPAAELRRGTNLLTFRHGTLGQPPNAPGESRRLAAAYHSILIGPQCLPLRGFGLPPPPGVERVAHRITGPLQVVGPAALRRRLDVPPGARLRYQLVLPTRAEAAAVTAVRVRDDDGAHELAVETLTPSLFRRTASRWLDVDLSPWSGRTVELVIEVGPEACRSAVTTAVLEHAGIFAAPGP